MADTLPLFCKSTLTPTYAPTRVLTPIDPNSRTVQSERKSNDYVQ